MAKTFKDSYKQFTELNKILSAKLKTNKEESIDLFKKFGGITEYIGTGNYQLNALLSGSLFGGIPNTRSIELAGPSGTGKTFLAFNIVREAQEVGYYIYYIDTEGSIDMIDMERMGVNPEQIELIKTIKLYSTLRQFASQLMQNKVNFPELKIMLVVDSFGMLNTTKELEDALKGHEAADMGGRAKAGRQLFRNITLDMSNLAIPFVFTNHTGANIDMFATDKEVPSGGGGPTYAASIILILDKAPIKITEDKVRKQVGVTLKAKTWKNRLSVPHVIEIELSFKHGMNKYYGLEQYIGWDNCMVERGTIYEKSELLKKWKDGIPKNTQKVPLKTYWFDKTIEKVKYDLAFVERSNAETYGVGDTVVNVPLEQFYTCNVFTQNTLEMLDKNVIIPKFQYSTVEDEIRETSLAFAQMAKKDEDFDIAEGIERATEEKNEA